MLRPAQYRSGFGGGFVYRGRAVPALQGKYVFTDFPLGRVLYIDADTLVPDQVAEIRELRLIVDGRERDLVDVAGFPNTYAPGAGWTRAWAWTPPGNSTCSPRATVGCENWSLREPG